MRNIALKIEYDGRNYVGWQRQENGLAIQEVMEVAIEKIVKHKVELFASGRTDSSVHALGQVANFFTERDMDVYRMQQAINSQLPEDIRVSKISEVSLDFHSRFSAIGKTYTYIIEARPYKSPFINGRAYYVKNALDIDSMKEAGELFIGEHDFAGFRSQGSLTKTTIRTIYSLDIIVDGDLIKVEISGNGFLYNMVRIIVGTLVDIGRGKKLDIDKALKEGKRELAGPTAPAHGLFLKEVKYLVDIW
ncbi:MAG: tRNA pseudouridine(38-40) synthase TruA [Filifactoraceae bacterium]